MSEKPMVTTEAQVFTIDPVTRSSWVPEASGAVPLSIYYHYDRRAYRVVALDGSQVVINCAITAGMQFKPSSSKFGQWEDPVSKNVYGVNFPSETFLQKFQQAFELAATGKAPEESSDSGPVASGNPAPAASNKANPQSAQPQQSGRQAKALYPFNGSNDTQLSFAAGQVITSVTSTSADSWLQGVIVDANGKTRMGVFPRNYVDLEGSGPSNAATAPTPGAAPVVAPMVVSAVPPMSPVHAHPVKQQQRIHRSSTDESMGAGPSPLVRVGAQRSSSAMSSVSAGTVEGGAAMEALKAENLKLKRALADSSANVKEWEAELQVLKNNNARLLAALQESFGGVESWKVQLSLHQDQNGKLSKKMTELQELHQKFATILSAP